MNMKLLLLCFCMIISSLGIAEQCKPPREQVCAFSPLSPDSIYIGIKVIFKNNNPNQVVYMASGCGGLSNYKFSTQYLTKIDKYIENKDITLEFMFCTKNQLINTQRIELSSDSKVICNVTDKMRCTKIKD